MAILDDDGTSSMGALDDDDPVGRVLIQPSSLPPLTVVDAWWPLLHRPVGERVGERGAVRLRLHVCWHSDLDLLLAPFHHLRAQISPPAHALDRPAFTLRLKSRRARVAAEYAYRGTRPDTRYSYPVLRANLAEASRAVLDLRACVGPVREVLFWRRPLVSLCLAVAWQLLTLWPEYIPACVPLSLVLLLNQTHLAAMRNPPLLRPLPFWTLCISALMLPRGRSLVRPIDLREEEQTARSARPTSTSRVRSLPHVLQHPTTWALGTLGIAKSVTKTTGQVTLTRTLFKADPCKHAHAHVRALTLASVLTQVGIHLAEGSRMVSDGGTRLVREVSSRALNRPHAAISTSGSAGSTDNTSTLIAAAAAASYQPSSPAPNAASASKANGALTAGSSDGAGGAGSAGKSALPSAEELDDDTAIDTIKSAWRSIVHINSVLPEEASRPRPHSPSPSPFSLI